jgi:hypothetical protein
MFPKGSLLAWPSGFPPPLVVVDHPGGVLANTLKILPEIVLKMAADPVNHLAKPILLQIMVEFAAASVALKLKLQL